MRAEVLSRRRLLAGLLLVPPALAGCSLGTSARDSGPDPLIALAAAARADVALVTAAITAGPDLAARLAPLRTARTDHADALDAEVARLAPSATPTPAPAPSSRSTAATLDAVRASVQASGKAAAAAALSLPAERVGLVASVAACCTTYAAVLT